MPIYEFYCSDCHVLYNFFSARVDTAARPDCPRCGTKRLERRPARFATLKHPGQDEPDPLANLDEDRLAAVMDSMIEEFGNMEESDDPRQMAALYRRLGEASGLEFGPRLEELMSRLEAGEDPDRLEKEMGDLLGEDDSLGELFRLGKRGWRSRGRPRVDDTLYFL